MKKISVLLMAVCLLFTGCAKSQDSASVESTASYEAADDNTADVVQSAASKTIYPIPDTTMDNLNDAILSVSLEEGDAYVDENGIMLMDLKIYTYDKYDMVDIASLNIGDTILTRSGKVKLTSREQSDTGIIHINGGLEEGGFDLVTNDSGIFYEAGFNDVKSWYEIGEITLPVSADFVFIDKSDLNQGEVMFNQDSFLSNGTVNYDFSPHNTTIRVEDAKIVEMNRVYTP